MLIQLTKSPFCKEPYMYKMMTASYHHVSNSLKPVPISVVIWSLSAQPWKICDIHVGQLRNHMTVDVTAALMFDFFSTQKKYLEFVKSSIAILI